TCNEAGLVHEPAQDEELLLHELRNRINMIGFALHAYRRDQDPAHLDELHDAYEAAVDLLGRLDSHRRPAPTGGSAETPRPTGQAENHQRRPATQRVSPAASPPPVTP